MRTVARISTGIALMAVLVTGASGAGPAIQLAQQSSPAAPAATALTGAVGETQTGLAAYYGRRLQGRRTASGERFNNNALTTGHQTLPFGTLVRITNPKNNRSVVLRVNDRGPTQPNRIVDVTQRAARILGFTRAGLTEVKLEVVQVAKPRRRG